MVCITLFSNLESPRAVVNSSVSETKPSVENLKCKQTNIVMYIFVIQMVTEIFYLFSLYVCDRIKFDSCTCHTVSSRTNNSESCRITVSGRAAALNITQTKFVDLYRVLEVVALCAHRRGDCSQSRSPVPPSCRAALVLLWPQRYGIASLLRYASYLGHFQTHYIINWKLFFLTVLESGAPQSLSVWVISLKRCYINPWILEWIFTTFRVPLPCGAPTGRRVRRAVQGIF